MDPFADVALQPRAPPHGPAPAGCLTRDFWELLDDFMQDALAAPGDGLTTRDFLEAYDDFLARELREQMDAEAWAALRADAARQPRALLHALARYTEPKSEAA